MVKNYSDPVKRRNGLWEVTVTDAATGFVVCIKQNVRKADIVRWVKEQKKADLGQNTPKRACMICGNAVAKDLEVATLYSDGDGNDDIVKEYICKEGKGCC